MNEKILELLERDCKIAPEQIAVMLDADISEVIAAIEKMENDNIILKYKALINWEKTSRDVVNAFIELKVTPQRGEGFDKVADRIYKFPQVKSLYLMSGGYDLSVIIEGQSMKDVAMFVAETLAPMESVISTATHFVLKKYKEDGAIFQNAEVDERQVITL